MSEENLSKLLEGIEIPPYVVNILKITGYYTKNSLINMNAEKIREMENFICQKFSNNDKLKENLDVMSRIFGDTLLSPDECTTFSFNPGARKLLLCEIPEKIKKFDR